MTTRSPFNAGKLIQQLSVEIYQAPLARVRDEIDYPNLPLGNQCEKELNWSSRTFTSRQGANRYASQFSKASAAQFRRRRERRIHSPASRHARERGGKCPIAALRSNQFAIAQQAHGALSWPASGSCNHREHAIQLGGGFAMLQPVGDNTKGERLYMIDRLRARLTVGHDAGELRHLGNPPAIFFPVGFYR
jgi:hypothetical protein